MALAVLEQRETLSGMEDLHTWWDNTMRRSEHFFNILSLYDAYTVTGEYLITLQAVQTRIEKAYYPTMASTARYYLLASISSVISGICTALAGQPEKAQVYMDAAAISLSALERELGRLGIKQ